MLPFVKDNIIIYDDFFVVSNVAIVYCFDIFRKDVFCMPLNLKIKPYDALHGYALYNFF